MSLPYFAIAILLHRSAQITTPQVYWLIGFGLLMVSASLVLGVRAFFDLWNAGRKGGKATLRGMIVAAAVVAPFLWYGYLGLTLPSISDVSTNPVEPPQFLQANAWRAVEVPNGANEFARYDADYSETIVQAYPKLASRRYNSGAQRILGAARGLAEARRWTVTAVLGQTEEETRAEKAQNEEAPADEDEASNELEAEPQAEIRLEAVARSPIFGFPQDIVLAIVPEAESTLVDMRASTRWGAHDFGRNADTITRFLSDLDTALVGIAGEG